MPVNLARKAGAAAGFMSDKALLALLMLPVLAGGAAGYGYQAVTDPDPVDVANIGKEMELAQIEDDIISTRRKFLVNEIKKRSLANKSTIMKDAKREVRI